MVGMAPRRSGPDKGRAAARAASARSVAAASSPFARATTSSPIAVSRTLRLSRSTSCTPSTVSSSLIPADSVDWVTNCASAATRKFRRSESSTR